MNLNRVDTRKATKVGAVGAGIAALTGLGYSAYKLYQCSRKGVEVTGWWFNKYAAAKGLQFYKWVGYGQVNNSANPYVMENGGFKFELGLNKDPVAFNPKGDCSPGGLYFSDTENVSKYRGAGNTLFKVTIPDDARVYIGEGKWKADKLVLSSWEEEDALRVAAVVLTSAKVVDESHVKETLFNMTPQQRSWLMECATSLESLYSLHSRDIVYPSRHQATENLIPEFAKDVKQSYYPRKRKRVEFDEEVKEIPNKDTEATTQEVADTVSNTVVETTTQTVSEAVSEVSEDTEEYESDFESETGDEVKLIEIEDEEDASSTAVQQDPNEQMEQPTESTHVGGGTGASQITFF